MKKTNKQLSTFSFFSFHFSSFVSSRQIKRKRREMYWAEAFFAYRAIYSERVRGHPILLFSFSSLIFCFVSELSFSNPENYLNISPRLPNFFVFLVPLRLLCFSVCVSRFIWKPFSFFCFYFFGYYYYMYMPRFFQFLTLVFYFIIIFFFRVLFSCARKQP